MVRADEATRFKPGQSGNPNCGPTQGASRMVNVWQHDEREALPVTSDEKRASVDYTAAQAVAAALRASEMATTATASAPRRRLRSSASSTHCSKCSVLA